MLGCAHYSGLREDETYKIGGYATDLSAVVPEGAKADPPSLSRELESYEGFFLLVSSVSAKLKRNFRKKEKNPGDVLLSRKVQYHRLCGS